MGSMRDELRLRLGVPVLRATTLPARWYSDAEHHRDEVDAVFRHGWSCVGTTDEVSTRGSYTTALVGGDLPVVIARDAKGVLHGFLNVCRHRAAPVAEGSGQARVLPSTHLTTNDRSGVRPDLRQLWSTTNRWRYALYWIPTIELLSPTSPVRPLSWLPNCIRLESVPMLPLTD